MTEREAIAIATRFMTEQCEVGFELIGARLTHHDERAVWRVMFELALAIKIDPSFVEAWFNYAGLLRDEGKTEAARTHLSRAIAIDPDYADAIYNLATLEFDAQKFGEARRWRSRYLELDGDSDWARTAEKGIAFIDMSARKTAG